jgi:hypothetical protein
MDDNRERYEPPAIEDVPLRPDETALLSCKSVSTPGRNPIFGCSTPRGPCSGIAAS